MSTVFLSILPQFPVLFKRSEHIFPVLHKMSLECRFLSARLQKSIPLRLTERRSILNSNPSNRLVPSEAFSGRNRFEAHVDPSENQGAIEGTGYLIVRASAARGAIPLENVTVHVRHSAVPDGSIREEGSRGEGAVVATLHTDRDGLSPRLALPAPPRYLSESPGNTKPYALYDIDAFLSGYSPSYFRNVPIFDTVTSLQTVELIPIPEGARPELSQDPPSFLFGSAENETL